jgi:hypothetical protein
MLRRRPYPPQTSERDRCTSSLDRSVKLLYCPYDLSELVGLYLSFDVLDIDSGIPFPGRFEDVMAAPYPWLSEECSA